MRPCFTVSSGLDSSCSAGTIWMSSGWPLRKTRSENVSPPWARMACCMALQPSMGAPSMATI